VILMLDETIITETPPLYACYGRIGEQVRVPISGNRSKRILQGALKVWSGEVLLLITDEWGQETHPYFLQMIRAHWRGWQIVRYEDRGSPHTADDSLELASALAMELRFFPKVTPELNAMDQLWRRVKGRTVVSRATHSIEASADEACQYILALRPHERLRQAGVWSGNFWLTT
jgi:transposase